MTNLIASTQHIMEGFDCTDDHLDIDVLCSDDSTMAIAWSMVAKWFFDVLESHTLTAM
jgi:hypothetical protein